MQGLDKSVKDMIQFGKQSKLHKLLQRRDACTSNGTMGL